MGPRRINQERAIQGAWGPAAHEAPIPRHSFLVLKHKRWFRFHLRPLIVHWPEYLCPEERANHDWRACQALGQSQLSGSWDADDDLTGGLLVLVQYHHRQPGLWWWRLRHTKLYFQGHSGSDGSLSDGHWDICSDQAKAQILRQLGQVLQHNHAHLHHDQCLWYRYRRDLILDNTDMVCAVPLAEILALLANSHRLQLDCSHDPALRLRHANVPGRAPNRSHCLCRCFRINWENHDHQWQDGSARGWPRCQLLPKVRLNLRLELAKIFPDGPGRVRRQSRRISRSWLVCVPTLRHLQHYPAPQLAHCDY